MEENVFPLPEVQKEFSKYVLVQLYVEDKDHAMIQDRLLKVATLPSYAVVKPDGETLVGFIGYDTNPATRVSGFVKFLADSAAAAVN